MPRVLKLMGMIILLGVRVYLVLPVELLPTLASKGERLMEARWYRRLENNLVWCQLCFRKCIIKEGERGFCRVRENKGGKLYSLVYEKVCSWQVAPIEKDGMYHLLPGGDLFALATASCNFRCRHCHNWSISQVAPEETWSEDISPEDIVEMAIRKGCKLISSTMTEPTVFYEYTHDTAKLAQAKGLKTLFHTNGALNPEPLRALIKHMDGVVVDLKGFTTEFYNEVSSAELEPVLRTLKIIKEERVHLEITNLVIPTLNDDLKKIREMCHWIKENLGPDVPLHFTRFFPAYKLTRLPPTPIATLEEARKIALEVGLRYVYIGNVPGHEHNSTYCSQCKKRIIHRIHFTVMSNNVEEGKCRFCGYRIPGIWK